MRVPLSLILFLAPVAACGSSKSPTPDSPATVAPALATAAGGPLAHWDTNCVSGDDTGAALATFSVACDNGTTFTLTAPEKSRTCATKLADDRIVGGLCTVEDEPGKVRVAAKVDCATGCVCTSGAGACEAR